MRAARATIASALALAGSLALAMAPGVLRAPSHHHDLDRAPVVRQAERAIPELVSTEVLPAEVPITPPPADLRGEPAPAVPVAEPFGRSGRAVDGEVLALVIGIDDYPGDGSDLGAAVADADLIDAALAGFGVPAGNRVVLRDGQAHRAQVVAAIRALVARADRGSTVVLAYAGHVRKVGTGREALVTADGGLITDEELATMLAPSRAPRMWVVLATCYAGGFTEVLGPGRILTGAASADALAYESPGFHASFLVHHLVREGWLEGRAGPSVQSAFAYADDRIAATRPERRPVQIDELGHDLVLGPGDPSAGSAATPAPGAHTAAPPPPPTSSPPPGREPESETTCMLGVALCHKP